MHDELQQLPGVGPSIAADLRQLGVRSIRDLARRNPDVMYHRLCELTGERQDPCVRYVFRCAVYVARTPTATPALRKWWTWSAPWASSRTWTEAAEFARLKHRATRD